MKIARYLSRIITVSALIAAFLSFGLMPAHAAEQTYIRVGLMQGQQQISVSADDDFVVKDVDGKKNYKFDKKKTVQISQKGKTVYVGSKGSQTTTVVVAVKNNAPVSVNGKRYRGALLIQPHQAGLTVINRLPLEQYLYGVVPNEMPVDWNMEALKAQAVAARSFALYDRNDGKHSAQGFDVCVTTDCQVYGGIASESAASNRAVDATRGQILTYGRQPICAAFHTASGGFTENSEDVWGSNVPYLRSVDDRTEVSPYSGWTKELTAEQLASAVSHVSGSLGTLKSIDTSSLQQKAGGKRSLLFTGSAKKAAVPAAQMRSLLGLKSSNFSVSVAENGRVSDGSVLKLNKPQSAKVVLTGSGFGHRLGMSQWGAKSLADKGKNYKQILMHYYTDVQLETLY